METTTSYGLARSKRTGTVHTFHREPPGDRRARVVLEPSPAVRGPRVYERRAFEREYEVVAEDRR